MSAAILLPLFEDISPAPVRCPPSPLTSAAAVRRGEILWLPGLARRPPPPAPIPASARPRPSLSSALPFVRRLTLFPDILVTPLRGLCLRNRTSANRTAATTGAIRPPPREQFRLRGHMAL